MSFVCVEAGEGDILQDTKNNLSVANQPLITDHFQTSSFQLVVGSQPPERGG